MSESADQDRYVGLSTDQPIWERFFLVAPLVVVGTIEPDGTPDLAPKHLVGPASWGNLFGFVCTPSHATYRNVVREEVFTVSYLRPGQIVQASLASAPRDTEGDKPSLAAIPTRRAEAVPGVVVEGCAIYLECRLDRIVDDLDDNSLVIGRIVAAHVDREALRDPDRDDADVLAASPVLAFLSPDHFATVRGGLHFPFHAGWKR